MRDDTKRGDCSRCEDAGWVCEEHPDKAMMHDDCSGAGMPCRDCAVPLQKAA